MPSAPAMPRTVDDLTAPWFARVLDQEVTAVDLLERSSGTTGRVRVALRGEPGVPASVFVKLPPFDERQRALVDRTGMGVAEAHFYRDLASEVPVRAPGVWFAGTDGADYVMVLEDLVAGGCRFPSPDDPDIATRARDIVEQLATLHAAYWESARFGPGGDLAWLTERGTRGGGGGRSFIHNAVATVGSQLDGELGDEFRRIATCYLEHAAAIVALQRDGESTLVHGDAHMGNLFVDPASDHTGFLDWAVVCRAPGIRDVAYVLCNSVPVDVREAIERNLVEHYCAVLDGAGVHLAVDEAWDQYRLHALYSWVSAAATAGMGSKWQPLHIGLRATARTTAACAHLDTVRLVEMRLA
ncbi:MAG: phosphotransferase family protein [Actinomycetota bacterium]